ncbi:membrane protein [Beggiatoa sp. SS]|nr:membrane protein [Beggiatoa sp. SS]
MIIWPFFNQMFFLNLPFFNHLLFSGSPAFNHLLLSDFPALNHLLFKNMPSFNHLGFDDLPFCNKPFSHSPASYRSSACYDPLFETTTYFFMTFLFFFLGLF